MTFVQSEGEREYARIIETQCIGIHKKIFNLWLIIFIS